MKTYIISDNHFSHRNILSFLNPDGTNLRNFDSVQEMDELMIDNWNRVVALGDKCYHLGDFCFSNHVLQAIAPRLNGTKILIKGNHDNLKPSQYLQYFKDIRASHVLDKFVLTHIPIHTQSLSRWKANIHGHTHANKIDDPRYFNACVENHNYTPIDFEYIRQLYRLPSIYRQT